MTETISQNDVLRSSFKEVGREYGFDAVEAEFAGFRELKVSWQRSCKWADFRVSDYIADAPPEVIHGLATSLFSKITGKDCSYSETFVGWMTASEFSEQKQSLYLKRSRNLTISAKGEHKDLDAAYGRLAALGLVKKDPAIHLTWTKEANVRRVGHCSVLMKVISISAVLDTDMIPDFVLDFVLYHELCHMIIGFDPSAKVHGRTILCA